MTRRKYFDNICGFIENHRNYDEFIAAVCGLPGTGYKELAQKISEKYGNECASIKCCEHDKAADVAERIAAFAEQGRKVVIVYDPTAIKNFKNDAGYLCAYGRHITIVLVSDEPIILMQWNRDQYEHSKYDGNPGQNRSWKNIS